MDLFAIEDPLEHRLGNLMITKMRLEMLKDLPSKGYEIVTKPEQIVENTICLVFDKTKYSVAPNPLTVKNSLEKKRR